VALDELDLAATKYGAPLPTALLPEPRRPGVRERFVARFGSRVGG
jgi:hypothetical protein